MPSLFFSIIYLTSNLVPSRPTERPTASKGTSNTKPYNSERSNATGRSAPHPGTRFPGAPAPVVGPRACGSFGVLDTLLDPVERSFSRGLSPVPGWLRPSPHASQRIEMGQALVAESALREDLKKIYAYWSVNLKKKCHAHFLGRVRHEVREDRWC